MQTHRVLRASVLAALSVSLVLIGGLVGAGAAAAQTIDDTTYPTVSTTPTSDPCVASATCGTAGTVPNTGRASENSAFPLSGDDAALLTLLGVVAVGSGTAIVLSARRR